MTFEEMKAAVEKLGANAEKTTAHALEPIERVFKGDHEMSVVFESEELMAAWRPRMVEAVREFVGASPR